MEKENIAIFTWMIENFSEWCKELHGKCIDSPPFSSKHFTKMELYPRGRNASGENMMVRINDVENIIRGEFSFFGSDGSLICTQRVKGPENGKKVIEVGGQRYDAVVDENKKKGDRLTLRFFMRSDESYEKGMCTRLDVMKMSLKIDERSIKIVERGYAKNIALIPFNENNTDWEGLQSKAATRKGETFEGLLLKAFRKNGKLLQLLLEPMNKKRNAVSVKICMSVLRRGCSLRIHEVKEHVFRDNATSWTLSESIKIDEVVGKSVDLLLSFKIVTGSVTKSYDHFFYECKGLSAVPFNDPSDVVTSNQIDELVTSELANEFMRLCRDDQAFSDVQLKCGTVSFPAHKAILSARSPVFKRRLLSSCDKREAESTSMDIEELDAPTLTRFLVFLYTGTLDHLEWESATNLYYAAQMYQVQTLKMKCSAFIRSIVSMSNVCEVLYIADRYQDEEMTSAAHDFILENYNDVLRSEEWKIFMKREPMLAVETMTNFGVKNCVGKRDPHQ